VVIVAPGPDTELVPLPAEGRVFAETVRPGLADCSPSGRIRLDALARWMQDVAYADVLDAGVADAAVWVIRRARVHVRRFPRFGELVQVSTFCSGLGRMWAERRTTIARAGEQAADVEAVALWVHLDPTSQRPTPLSAEELATYGAGPAAQRRVTARLRHPAAPPGAAARPWQFRASDCDLAAHVNNAAYWVPLEEELLSGAEPEAIDVEIEHRSPAQPGDKRVLSDGPWRWIADPAGEIHASMLIGGSP
jgi:acyl-ACP thioesterase